MVAPRFGVLANIGDPEKPNEVEQVCRAVDRFAYDSLAFGDHLSWPTPEAWTVLSWAAGITDSVELTHLVLNNTYRHPSLLATMGATLDFLSDGRYRLGIGAGSSGPEEYRQFGLSSDAFPERIDRLRESLVIISQLWEKGQCEFDGEHFRLRDASMSLRPVQDPRPPVLIGGRSDAVLEVAVNYEGWNFGFDRSPADCSNTIEEFRERSTEQKTGAGDPLTSIGILLITSDTKSQVDEQVTEMARQRDVSVEELRREYMDSFVGTPAEIHPKVEAYLDAGVDEFFLWGPSVRNPEHLQTFAKEVIKETR